MTKLKDQFTRKEFKDCCGRAARSARSPRPTSAEYGSRKEGLEKLKVDIKAAKKGGGKGKKGGGKKKGRRQEEGQGLSRRCSRR